jgi:hypothetical protein
LRFRCPQGKGKVKLFVWRIAKQNKSGSGVCAYACHGVTGSVGNREIGIWEGNGREKVAKVLVMLLGSRGRKRMLGGWSGLVDHGFGGRVELGP